MIIPSRWYASGKGLDKFREDMLNDDQTRKIVDFANSTEVFPGVDIAGGICYFLWEQGTSGPCEVVNKHEETEIVSIRPLNEFATFIRDGRAVPIIHKVQNLKEPNMGTQVSSRKPFGLGTNVRPTQNGDLILRWNGGEGPYQRSKVAIGNEMIDDWKVITSKVSYDHAGLPDKNGMRRLFSIIDILPPGTICTETYLVVGCFKNEEFAKNLAGYLRTRFVRFLVSQLAFTQDIFKEKFLFVPILDVSKCWTDELLYERYGFNKEDISFIESKIRPMELNNE